MNNKKQVRSVILQTVKENKWLSAGIAASIIGAVVCSLIPPLILGRIVDTITGGAPAELYMFASYFGTLALSGVMESAREGLLIILGQKITHSLRSRLMEKFVNLTTDNLCKQEPGALVSRFVGDADTIENLFSSGIVSMFADACKIISILAVIWFQTKGLTLILLVVLPLLLVFTRHVQKNTLAAQIENRKAVGRASAHVPETLHNIRTIHTLGKEPYMEERYGKYLSESYRAMEKTNFYDAIYSPIVLILNAFVVAVVMLLSASVKSNILDFFGMSAGTSVTIIHYISQIFTPIESLGMEIQTIQSAIAGVHRVNDFLSLEEMPPSTAVSPAMAAATSHEGLPFVEFRDVCFGYDAKPVLEHLSFKIMDADQVTLTGRTGVGKSTVLKLLFGLYAPQSGAVYIHGIPATDIPAQQRRALFGYVEQTFHMVPGSVRDQITLYDSSISDEAVRSAAELTGLQETIESFENGYDTPCTPELFSQGQWQLLSIARAAAAEPDILLFDEITANLDVETETAVLTALKRVAQARTVISISHRTTAELGRVITLS